MAALQLNRYETEMAIRAEAAELCDFTGPEWRDEDMPEIRAEVIRAMLLGLPIQLLGESQQRVVDIKGAGIRIRHPSEGPQPDEIAILQARITGRLDLDHASHVDGASLPNLALPACIFEQPISLRHARIREINFTGSHLSHISAQYSVIEGSVDLSGIRALADGPKGADGDAQCWVDFSNARIGSTFRATGARLVAPALRSALEQPHYALELDHAELGGSLDIGNGFEANGGITLELAVVKGHIRGKGSRIRAGEGAAIRAYNVEVRGDFDLGPSVNIEQDTVISDLNGDIFFFKSQNYRLA